MRVSKSYIPEIVSIFILILIVLPGMLYYNQNSVSYTISPNTTSWSPNRTNLAFVRFKNNNNNLGEIMVWSKGQKSFQSIHYITSANNNGCFKYKYATCLPRELFPDPHLSLSPNNKLLVLMPSYPTSKVVFFIYNITSKSLIGTKNFDESAGTGISTPKWSVNWINDSFWYVGKEGLVNLLNSKILYSYGSNHPSSSPILSPDGERVAYTRIDYISNNITKTQETQDVFSSNYSLIIRNVQTNSLLSNLSLESYSTPYFWSSNSSEILFATNLQIPMNYSIYNVDSKKISYTFNETNNLGSFYYITPDFKYLTFQGQNNYRTIDLSNNTIITFQNSFHTNPEVSMVYTGNDKVFRISTFPDLGTYFSYKLDYAYEKNLGFAITSMGIITIVIILITKNRRNISLFLSKYWNKMTHYFSHIIEYD